MFIRWKENQKGEQPTINMAHTDHTGYHSQVWGKSKPREYTPRITWGHKQPTRERLLGPTEEEEVGGEGDKDQGIQGEGRCLFLLLLIVAVFSHIIYIRADLIV